MVRRFTIKILMDLASRIGANPAKAVSRSNVSFFGTGPKNNPLFQERLAGLETAAPQSLGKLETLWAKIEDAVGWAKDGKLNSIQTEILGHNLTGIKKVLHPPALPMASVTPIRGGIEGLRRFPRETHKFMGRPLKDKDFSEIDRMILEGKLPDARGRTWNFKTPETGVDASGLKLAKPPKESSKSFLEEMGARGHKVLKPGTPEYEAYMKKGLRTFSGSKLPGPGIGKGVLDAKIGMSRAIARQILQQDTRLNLPEEVLISLRTGSKGADPLELMQKYYGRSMTNFDDFLNSVNIEAASPTEFAEMVLKNVELIPQFAEGGLADILQAPRRGRVVHPGGYAGTGKRQAFIDLARAGGSRQDFIDLAGSFRRKSIAVPIDPFKELTIYDMLMSGALPSELKHGGLARILEI